MPTTRSKMALRALLVSLLLASACANKAPTSPAFPRAADLKVEPKPVLAVDALASDQALNDHEADVESWGERGWRQVARICRWAQDLGMKGVSCPEPESTPERGGGSLRP